MTLVFEMSLPLRDCSSNGNKGSWRKKGLATKTYRQEGWIAFLLAKPGGYIPPAKVRMSLVFGTKGARRVGRYAPRDRSNALAAFKAAQDGIADAGGMVDDSAEHCDLGGIAIDRTVVAGRIPPCRLEIEGVGQRREEEMSG